MIGLVERLDAAQRIVDRNAVVVDLLRVPDHARDGAEPARDPHGARVRERGQAALEHARIELVGLAVHVHIAAREMHAHQGMPARNDPGDQLIDEGILGATQGRKIELGGGQERPRIDAPAVRGIEHDRPTAFDGFKDLERGVEFGLQGIVHRRSQILRHLPCRPSVHFHGGAVLPR